MALVIKLRVGDDFSVGHNSFVVESIKDQTDFVVKRNDGRVFRVSRGLPTYIQRNVQISAGLSSSHGFSSVSVAFDAPRDVAIVRGELKRKSAKYSGRVACSSCDGFGCDQCKNVGHFRLGD